MKPNDVWKFALVALLCGVMALTGCPNDTTDNTNNDNNGGNGDGNGNGEQGPESFAGIDLKIGIKRADSNTEKFVFTVSPTNGDTYTARRGATQVATATTNTLSVPAAQLTEGAAGITDLTATATRGGGTSKNANIPGMLKYSEGKTGDQAMKDWGKFLIIGLNALERSYHPDYTGGIIIVHNNIKYADKVDHVGNANIATEVVLKNWGDILDDLESYLPDPLAVQYLTDIKATLLRIWFNAVTDSKYDADMAAEIKAIYKDLDSLSQVMTYDYDDNLLRAAWALG